MRVALRRRERGKVVNNQHIDNDNPSPSAIKIRRKVVSAKNGEKTKAAS